MEVFSVTQGNGPIVLGQPHVGTHVPSDIFDRLNARGQGLDDTDWHIAQLYEGLLDDVTVVSSHIHRYVIDANRDPSGRSLYPGANTTELVPTTDFDGEPIWDRPPTSDEITERTENFHAPYHAALNTEIARVKSIHGFAILFDCHSIRSQIPFLFDGALPDLNIGTNSGASCAPAIEAAVTRICKSAAGFSFVVNGRFKGGWTTRHYGRPRDGVHAVQLELSQTLYLKEEAPPFDYDPEKASLLRVTLKKILSELATIKIPPAVEEA